VLSLLFVLVAAQRASAQYLPPKDAPIQFGQVHLYIPDPNAQKQFWTIVGAESYHVLTTPIGVIKFPNVVFFLNQRATPSKIEQTTIRHVAVQVQNLRVTLDRLSAAGFQIVTSASIARARVKDGIAFDKDFTTNVAFVMAPDNITVELLENKELTSPLRFDHVRFAARDVKAVQAWYVDRFGAKASKRGSLYAVDLPNNISFVFSPAVEPPSRTTGQIVDHIGFQVAEPETLFKTLVTKGVTVHTPYTKVQGRDRSFAYIEDPWGTWIELNGGDPGLVADTR
jgi:catechol 2,3-dioxygenase-like lactoylglutathione lyase family enzyme